MVNAGLVEWAVFWTAVAVVLVVDIAVARAGGRSQTVRSAAVWSGVWIGLGLAFGAWVAVRFGGDAGLSYLTAYTLEKSLSVDNLFVFVLIFSQTGIPAELQHRALFWGIVGALIMRAILIALGVYLLEQFHWVIYAFAALLVYAAVRTLRGEERQRKFAEASCSLCTSWIARFIPITPVAEGARFLVRRNGRLMATPLLVALVVIETTDLVFAVDSIPAVLAVTRDPFLVYTSNVFALLGLRSLYFVLAGAIRGLRFLRVGLAIMLLFVAAKMLLADVVEIPPGVSLAVVACIFTVAILASRMFPGRPSALEENETTPCTHRDQIKDVKPNTPGCEECTKIGDSWVHLRMCLTCGHVGCCDSSKNKHATGHFHATGHPIMRSIEPGEQWTWCFVDRVPAD
jgi:tellurite resistance protein TerC